LGAWSPITIAYCRIGERRGFAQLLAAARQRRRVPREQLVGAQRHRRDAQRPPGGLDDERAPARHRVRHRAGSLVVGQLEQPGGQRGLHAGRVVVLAVAAPVQAGLAGQVQPQPHAPVVIDVGAQDGLGLLEVDGRPGAQLGLEVVV
jgi:hypothetical protein